MKRYSMSSLFFLNSRSDSDISGTGQRIVGEVSNPGNIVRARNSEKRNERDMANYIDSNSAKFLLQNWRAGDKCREGPSLSLRNNRPSKSTTQTKSFSSLFELESWSASKKLENREIRNRKGVKIASQEKSGSAGINFHSCWCMT
jgi:hypothetical protein